MKDVKDFYTKEEKSKYFERYQEIMEKDKFFVGRLSHNEGNLCALVILNHNIQEIVGYLGQMRDCTGINISNPDSLSRYVNAYMQAVHNCTIVGTMKGTGQMIYTWCAENIPKKEHFPACCLEPFYFFKPCSYNAGVRYKWPNIMANKRLLIVSSHFHTIKKQISKLDKLFPPYRIFNNNSFVVVKPPMTLGDTSKEWHEHFETFKNNISKEEFDIALVSCGGYGMPICDFIYCSMNKSCIYMGGALQLLFGIMGKRWEKHAIISGFRNEHWVYPLAEDVPENHQNYCEGGTYWH